ncbi:hypothetical protein SAL_0431 [Streptococcus agalactiae 515]|nr:hypothetical protein SAL_0431 [Streptococcus agalactiae 515]
MVGYSNLIFSINITNFDKVRLVSFYDYIVNFWSRNNQMVGDNLQGKGLL